eukprot:TRINITY_DN3029_c0_g2_i1.p1 TRINITY_DN3029_c0_g2~~TRINITY_DN3029_c0_g2_i1.p1  ORF type:complete len:1280 (+),score=456.61 TRINITY_DN3029_c0_g2_i1:132-3971(+)
MSEKQKGKDKEKKRRDSVPAEKEAKRARPETGVEDAAKAKLKEPEKKEKKEKDKEKKKDKDKKEKKENGSTKKEEPKASSANGAPTMKAIPIKKDEISEAPEKKLKAWQDDALEVDSDEEQTKDAPKQSALSKIAAKSSEKEKFTAEAPAEADTLDVYMADLGTGAKGAAKDALDGSGMGVMDSGRVKSITLEEIEAMMGGGKSSQEQEPAVGSEQGGGSSSSAAAPPPDAPATANAEEGEEDDEFHAAFMREMRKLRGEDDGGNGPSQDFQAASAFSGARPGFVFKKGKKGLGYYRDLGPFAVTNKASKTDADGEKAELGDFRRKKQAKRPLDDDFEGQPMDEDADDEDDGKDDAEEEEEEAEKEGEEVKVVETKKEKRRKRREAKEAEAKAKAEAAKQKAKEGFGEGDGDRMDSDPDRSEQSSEEQMESYFDLVKRFTTKKVLPEVDHSKIDYKPFRKNLYVQVKEITNMKDHEVDDFRRTHGDITVRGKRCPHPIKSFLQCGLPERIMKILEKRDYETPFPIQMQAIPALMCGRDLIGVAQTGSGKTLAYLLPVLRHVLDQPKLADGDGPIAFMVAPTRELALQIQREANVFCKAVNLTSVCAYGGGPMGEQLSALKRGAELLVGTPGRLIDVLTCSGGKITNLRRVTFMVLDEADRMFDMGFEPQIGMFLQSTRPDKQVAMFSATLPAHVEALARKVLKKPVEITVGERNTAATNVTQFVEVLDESQKFYRLLQLLGEWQEHGAIIIFVHQQKDVDEMFTELLKYGYPPLALHGGQDQQDRDFTLQDFKDGISNILIATSVAARGIDVKNVILVVNFKVPDHLEDYIHRIGRTGRAGKAGFAYTFIQPDEADRAQDMVDALRQCNQEVPLKLKALAEEHQTAVNTGQAEKRKRWGGFGGKGFKYDNTEKSRQQKDRQKAKQDALIGVDLDEEEDEFKDPWLEPDKPKKGEGKGKGKSKGNDNGDEPQSRLAADPNNTVAAAAQVAAKMQAAAAKAAGKADDPAAAVAPAADASGAAAKAPPPPPKAKAIPKKSDKEIEEQAQQMAEDTLKSLPDEVREKQLPALKEKLILKLRKAEQEKLAEAASALAKPAPPPKEKAPVEQNPIMKAIPLVPGVLGQGLVPAKANMVTKAIESLQAQAAKKGHGTEELAEAKAASMQQGTAIPPGMYSDELEINDYPQIARQKISHRDPLVSIEEMTGARVQVKGQHFNAGARMPEGAKKLYVEIYGPTTVSVARAKHEVHKMMEALAIRTLNIPGLSRNVMGTPGRYDPVVGK